MDADPSRVLVYCVIPIIKFLIPVYIYLFIIFNKGHFGVFDCTTLEKTLTDTYASQARLTESWGKISHNIFQKGDLQC